MEKYHSEKEGGRVVVLMGQAEMFSGGFYHGGVERHVFWSRFFGGVGRSR